MNNLVGIPAITLWQPYEALIRIDEKHFETRGWAAPDSLVGQQIAIHAAKRWTRNEQALFDQFNQLFPTLEKKWPLTGDPKKPLVLGAVGCICILKKCYSTDSREFREKIMPVMVPMRERAFGNYARGRFAWHLELVEVFDEPIPATGKQGLWRWERP